MARRAGDPKVRYIGFRMASDRAVPRQALIAAIKRTGRALDRDAFESAEPWLTRYDGQRGIVRCHHHGADFTRTLLNAVEKVRIDDDEVPVDLETVGTSGTIRALVTKHLPDLEDLGRRRR